MTVNKAHAISLVLKIAVAVFALIVGADWSSIVDPKTALYITSGLSTAAFLVHALWGLQLPTVTVSNMPDIKLQSPAWVQIAAAVAAFALFGEACDLKGFFGLILLIAGFAAGLWVLFDIARGYLGHDDKPYVRSPWIVGVLAIAAAFALGGCNLSVSGPPALVLGVDTPVGTVSATVGNGQVSETYTSPTVGGVAVTETAVIPVSTGKTTSIAKPAQ